jgi:hypothetical protein
VQVGYEIGEKQELRTTNRKKKNEIERLPKRLLKSKE